MKDGRQIGGYTLSHEIGRGGAGTVFKAFDSNGREVALKLIRPSHTDCLAVERFNLEVKRLEGLRDAHICRYIDHGSYGDERYLVMELCSGITLLAAIPENGFAPGLVPEMATQIASALTAVHGAGLVHRDLKPNNLMLAEDGSIKLIDFGLALSSGDIATGPQGTIAYMSPEQRAGGAVDATTDIWAFGFVLFKMITGQLPSGLSHRDKELLRRRKATERWIDVFQTCVAVKSDSRYSNGERLLAALENASSVTSQHSVRIGHMDEKSQGPRLTRPADMVSQAPVDRDSNLKGFGVLFRPLVELCTVGTEVRPTLLGLEVVPMYVLYDEHAGSRWVDVAEAERELTRIGADTAEFRRFDVAIWARGIIESRAFARSRTSRISLSLPMSRQTLEDPMIWPMIREFGQTAREDGFDDPIVQLPDDLSSPTRDVLERFLERNVAVRFSEPARKPDSHTPIGSFVTVPARTQAEWTAERVQSLRKRHGVEVIVDCTSAFGSIVNWYTTYRVRYFQAATPAISGSNLHDKGIDRLITDLSAAWERLMKEEAITQDPPPQSP